MKRQNKKGFTIVELVIVIAVIAILAAVLIPTFSNVIQQANESKDVQLVRNLNTALAADIQKHTTMQSALDAADGFGYDVGKINASATDNEILWDSENDVFVYLKGEAIEYIPGSVEESKKITDGSSYKLWQIVKEMPATTPTRSIYAAGTNWTGDVAVSAGFDAGKNTNIASVTYTGTTAKEVVIRTNGGDLKVNAPSDIVKHYGVADYIDIVSIDTASYHEYGEVMLIQIAEGHLELESSSNVNGIHVNTKTTDDGVTYSSTEFNNVSITLNTNIEMPKFSRDAVTIAENGTKVCTLEIGESKSVIYLFNDGVYEQVKLAAVVNGAEQVAKFVEGNPDDSSFNKAADQIANVVSNGTYTVTRTTDESGNVTNVTIEKEDGATISNGKTAEEAKEENLFKGEGTTEKPYQVASGRDLINLIKFINDEDRGNVSIELTRDIDFTKDANLEDLVWIPIGNATHPFTGTIDGKGHSVIGMSNQGKAFSEITNDSEYLTYYTSSSDSSGWANYGFVGYGKNCTIKNISFVSANFSVENKVEFNMAGIVAGQLEGSCIIEKVTIDENSTLSGADKVGGFVGKIKSGIITIKDSSNAGNITAKDGDNPRAGGFVGQCYGSVSFDNCNNTGKITACWASDFVSHMGAGGDTTLTLNNCVANGVLLDDGTYNGAIKKGTIVASLLYATVTINATDFYEGSNKVLVPSASLVGGGSSNLYGTYMFVEGIEYFAYKVTELGYTAEPNTMISRSLLSMFSFSGTGVAPEGYSCDTWYKVVD